MMAAALENGGATVYIVGRRKDVLDKAVRERSVSPPARSPSPVVRCLLLLYSRVSEVCVAFGKLTGYPASAQNGQYHQRVRKHASCKYRMSLPEAEYCGNQGESVPDMNRKVYSRRSVYPNEPKDQEVGIAYKRYQ